MPNLYLIGVLVLVVLGFIGERAWDKHRIDSLQTEVVEANNTITKVESEKVMLQTKIEADGILDEAKKIRDNAALNAAVLNAQVSERRIAQATEEKIRNTSMTNSEKYTEFVIDVAWPNNIKIIECLSNLRNIHNETDPCIGHIR